MVLDVDKGASDNSISPGSNPKAYTIIICVDKQAEEFSSLGLNSYRVNINDDSKRSKGILDRSIRYS